KRIVGSKEPVHEELAEFPARMARALDDDLNTPAALAHAAAFLKQVNELCDRAGAKGGQVGRDACDAALAGFEALAEVLGIGAGDPEQFRVRVRNRRARTLGIDVAEVERAILDRAEARKAKDFARADRVRDE